MQGKIVSFEDFVFVIIEVEGQKTRYRLNGIDRPMFDNWQKANTYFRFLKGKKVIFEVCEGKVDLKFKQFKKKLFKIGFAITLDK